MEILKLETIENIIELQKGVIEVLENEEIDEDYDSSFDKCIIRGMEELKQYRIAEEQGLLLRLPCKVGDDVYKIPSKVNYDLNVLSRHEENNRVYHQKISRIVLEDGHWYVELDKDIEYGTGRICIDTFFGETWFLTRTEAEEALRRMEGEK